MSHDLDRAREILRLRTPSDATERQKTEWAARRQMLQLLAE